MRRDDRTFSERITVKAASKRRARRRQDESIWFGLGLFGLVGWSVAIPTLLGLAIGIWIDANWTGQISWTLTLLAVGVAVGCLNAWFWVERERRSIERGRGQVDDDG